ncbi:MAG TPA: SpvB/TcaC N-terminal domain-containing protein [Nannocystaceae bacterium]|nr:SpvB/TcaC N-terminal domain-containing protein [Nannocystaceae bacterium]
MHVPGGEQPGATVPEAARATAGLSLPKVGEKWATSAPTGSGGVTIGVPLPPGRGITPAIAIGYTTMGGNGPFGWGWRGPVPYFTRTTTKAIVREHGRGLPEYDDAAESDVFLYSDADELVKVGEGLDASGAVAISYRARTEGGFARIQRIEKSGRSHFVVRDASNIVSFFGLEPESCVTDPNDPKRVFRWYLQEQRDDRGNVIVYRYKAEDLANVDTGAPHEQGRTGTQTQRYAKRILYGNRDVPDAAPLQLASLDDDAARARFMFEVVFDYGEHNPGAAAGVDDDNGWPARPDTFSNARAGFEVRTRRLCRRVLVFHRFAQLGPKPVLTRALELGYDEDPVASRLVTAQLTGYGESDAVTLPPRTFTYSPRAIRPELRIVDAEKSGKLDLSLPMIDAELFDLEGDGRTGILTREEGRFVYRAAGDAPGTFASPQAIAFGATPSEDPAAHLQRWLDVSGRGRPALVEFGPSDATVFEREDDGDAWKAGAQIGGTPPVGKDPIAEQHRVYLADLDGDGICDVLVAREGELRWWRRMGESSSDGWNEQEPIAHDGDENTGPGAVLFVAARDLAPEGTPRNEAIVLADMTGDGLVDVVRVRADEVAYWPNLGYGKFGGKVKLSDGVGFDVDETQIRVCDVDGVGTTDILVFDKEGGATLWLNESGNRLVSGAFAATAPLAELGLSSLARIDGAMTASLVWAPKTADAPVTILDFMPEPPYLLVRDESGTGVRTTIRYGTSGQQHARAIAEGTPWRTRLPIAVPVVEGTISEDLVRGTRFSSSYRYAHGHYDPAEREFRGFAFVEQLDVEVVGNGGPAESGHQTAEAEHTIAPVRTKSWFVTGAEIDLHDEYDRHDGAATILPAPDLAAFGKDDRRDALRALRGVLLRSETYSDAPGSDPDAAKRPFVTVSNAWTVRSVKAKGGNHHGSMLPLSEQSLTYTYEREAVPDPRLVQTAVLEVDALGFATRTAEIAYPRRTAVPEPKVVPPPPPKTDPPGPGLVRLVGMAFDTDKSFVLPSSLPGLAVANARIAERSGGAVLVVGHTDRTGASEDNLGISLQRARRVVEFLRHDVAGWLLLYGADMPASIRWGMHEDRLMLAAVGFADDVQGFQRAVGGLVDDGDMGPATRAALIERYMATAGAAIAADVVTHAIGAGESFPAEVTDDGVASAKNRRTELLLFGDAIDPPAPEKFLAADGTEYATWIARATEVADVDATSGAVSGTQGVRSPLPPEPVPEGASAVAPSDDPQLRTAFVVREAQLVHQDEAEVLRLGTAVESRTFEITGKPGDPRAPMSLAAVKAAASGGTEIPFEQKPSGAHERRLIGKTRTYFYDDALKAPATLGVVGKRAVPAKTLAMAFSDALAEQLLPPLMIASRKDSSDKVLASGGYMHEDGAWWVPSPRTVFDASAFFLPIAVIDPFGHVAEQQYYDRDAYLVVRRTVNPAGGDPLMSSAAFEYRTFGARGSFDPNGSATLRRFDALGRVVAEVRRGDPGGRETAAQEDASGLRASSVGSEGDDEDAPTQHYVYDDHAFVARGAPTSVQHFAKLEYGRTELRVSLGITFFDGAGAVLQSKVRTDDGSFRASGRTVVNNKGLPVVSFGPFASSGAGFDGAGGQLLATMRYDALGRCVRTDYPDGTHTRVAFDAWSISAFDRNDTVKDSGWLAANRGATPAHTRAAELALRHADTPSTTRLDVLGRAVATFERLRDDDDNEIVQVTRQHLDISGNAYEVVDARGNVAEQNTFGMLGQVLRTIAVDAGERRALSDVAGGLLRASDPRGNVFFVEYDELRRPLEEWVHTSKGDVLLVKRMWGDGKNDRVAADDEPGVRQRGRLVRVYDGGGETRFVAYDMDGNPTVVKRRVLDLPRMLKSAQVDGVPMRARMDWSALGGAKELAGVDGVLDVIGALEDKSHRMTARYDARGRALETTLPMSGSIHRTRYTEDGLVRRIDRETAAGTKERVLEVEEFDAYGRPTRLRQGEAAVTRSTYDVVTERLLRLQTSAGGKALQDLQYTYDPSGNITQVRDGAQRTIFNGNAAVEAVNDYRYDALYRLVEASGREHEGQAANGRTPRTNDAASVPVRATSPNDPQAMRRYVQRYRYDAVGNVTSLQHHAGAGSFRREYAYAEKGNRLRATGNAALALEERYAHDVAGNMVAMPHLQALQWDELDQLEMVRRGTQQVWMQYAGGVRVRKLVLCGDGVTEDRLVLGGEELFTKRRNGAVVEKTLTEHVGGGLQVDIKLVKDGETIAEPTALRRYAIADHLGSTKVEVDEEGVVIAYEEFHPFGTTSFRAMRGQLDAAANRFRYTGMERDEETGLSLHGARYYANWLGRWTAADPMGIAGGINLYAYCAGDPVGLSDTSGAEPERIRVEVPPCDATCRAGIIESYKEARGESRDAYMDAYADWMRRSGSMSRDEDSAVRADLRAKYAEWQAYGNALGSMYATDREFRATEYGAGLIASSTKMIVATTVVAGAVALGLVGGAAAAPWFKSLGLGALMTGAASGAVSGAISGGAMSGSLALTDGASAREAFGAALSGAGWGALLGAVFGYYGARLGTRFAPRAAETTAAEVGGFAITQAEIDDLLGGTWHVPGRPSRHPDFHGPWRPLVKKDWGDYLRARTGTSPPESMVRPHAHHGVFKRGRRGRQRELVEQAQEIVRRRAGVDPIWDLDNLGWAPNKGHTNAVAEDILNRLRSLDATNAPPEDFRRLLRTFLEEAAAR